MTIVAYLIFTAVFIYVCAIGMAMPGELGLMIILLLPVYQYSKKKSHYLVWSISSTVFLLGRLIVGGIIKSKIPEITLPLTLQDITVRQIIGSYTMAYFVVWFIFILLIGEITTLSVINTATDKDALLDDKYIRRARNLTYTTAVLTVACTFISYMVYSMENVLLYVGIYAAIIIVAYLLSVGYTNRQIKNKIRMLCGE